MPSQVVKFNAAGEAFKNLSAKQEVAEKPKSQAPAHAPPEDTKAGPKRVRKPTPVVSKKPETPKATLVNATSSRKIIIYVRMSNVKQFDTFCQVELQVRLLLWRRWLLVQTREPICKSVVRSIR